ncbi:MAG: thiolase family protein [Acidimicrobiaceae bacterium]|nr:thiolase family protein [Acidimicrobiaceae bacterium]
MRKFEDDVVISGIGQSEVGRWLGRSDLGLTIDAISAAVTDAGLDLSEVDGLATYPGGGTSINPGFAGPPLIDVYDALGLRPAYLMGNFEGPAQLGPLLNGCLAVSAGAARHVVVYRTVTEGSARAALKQGGTPAPAGPNMSVTPFGDGPPPVRYALLARRHFHQYGTTREQLGQIALTARKHARLNPKAVLRDTLTMDDYLHARMIADPLCLLDCDIYCDGSTAFVLSRAEYAPDAPNRVIHVEALGMAPPERSDYVQHTDLRPGLLASEHMWKRTDLSPADVDVAGLYDGFSILTMLWLEALGFCGLGESGAFVEGGERISIGGELPINTNGGQLSAGRLHGFGLVHEMCLQLRGRAEGRQVPSAQVAAVSVGALPYVGAMLLRAGS